MTNTTTSSSAEYSIGFYISELDDEQNDIEGIAFGDGIAETGNKGLSKNISKPTLANVGVDDFVSNESMTDSVGKSQDVKDSDKTPKIEPVSFKVRKSGEASDSLIVKNHVSGRRSSAEANGADTSSGSIDTAVLGSDVSEEAKVSILKNSSVGYANKVITTREETLEVGSDVREANGQKDSPNRLDKIARDNNIAYRDKPYKPTASISESLKASRAIRIYSEIPSNKKFKTASVAFKRFELFPEKRDSSDSSMLVEINDSSNLNITFYSSYGRYHAAHLAVISRVYLLATISMLRTEMQDSFAELERGFAELEVIGKGDVSVSRLQRLYRKIHEAEESKKKNLNLREVFAILEGAAAMPAPKVESIEGERKQSLFGEPRKLAERWLKMTECLFSEFQLELGHKVAGIRDYIVKIMGMKTVAICLIAMALFVFVVAIVWLLRPGQSLGSLSMIGCAIIIFALAVFCVIAVNFQTLEVAIEEKLNAVTSERLGEILTHLTQTNACIAALNIRTYPAIGSTGSIRPLSEHFLHKLDNELHVKEAVISFEKVVLARQRDLSSRIQHVREERQKARRLVTSAGGGIFTGFATFELGEAVLKFVHLKHGQDDRSMFFWLAAEVGPFGNPDLKNDGKVENAKMGAEFQKCLVNTKPPLTAETCFPQALQEHFANNYLRPEAQAYGALLAICLVASILAAIIGWRKPADEQSGAHGHH